MLELLTLFILKILDCSLSTVKTIYLVKNKNFLSSLFSTLSAFFYLLMLTKLNKADSLIAVVVICLANFAGSYIPTFIFDKLEDEKVYIFEILANTNEQGKEIADSIRSNNFAIATYKGFNLQKELVLCCKVFSNSKEESILLESIIPKDVVYHVSETKKHVNLNN